ncbi:MAG: glycerol kinase GlpK [Rubellimicrobium sp.]|nr:glycerol kinase GlpK [Rubellimicrobium sp.]
MAYVLALDQGTSSTRAIVFDGARRPVASAQQEFPQHFPHPGWVEHDPADLWRSSVAVMREAVARAGLGAADIAAIGITNQRETLVVWDRDGRPVHNAIVWQDRRTAAMCESLRVEGFEDEVTLRTGLLLDPYFSGTKLAWILDHVEGARARAVRGDLLAGTVDSWLIWNLTAGRTHATDATNASRTMLYDIHRGAWDSRICAHLDIPPGMLPEVRDCAADYGMTDVLGAPVPILGVAGDQQAAAMGQACFSPGMMKATYGTGCFALMNTGAVAVRSHNRMLTTVAAQLDGKASYALEGSIFIAGAVVQWLRDGLGIIGAAAETQALAERADPEQELYLVPAFTGLGAPWWDAGARGAIFGLTRNSGPAEFARAALESVGFQTVDLLDSMARDWPEGEPGALRVDGGMTASGWTMQFLADISGRRVECPASPETTALGAAWLAGMRAGVWPGADEFARTWAAERSFAPAMNRVERVRRQDGWRDAVGRVLTGPRRS